MSWDHERALLLSAAQNYKGEVSYGWWSDDRWEEAFESLVRRGLLEYSRWHGCPPHETTEYRITDNGRQHLEEITSTPQH